MSYAEKKTERKRYIHLTLLSPNTVIDFLKIMC